jgi:hydroxymethylpyrimidine pyrophosphatase-like HAD family hydrolase
VRLLGLDIDGCLTEPDSKVLSLEVLARLRRLNRRELAPDAPDVFFCSGRPHGFVEALMRVCDCRVPSVLENGTGLVLPEGFRIEPLFSHQGELEAKFATCQKWVETRGYGRIVPGKVLTLSFYPAMGIATDQLRDRICEEFRWIGEGVGISAGPTSVDLVPPGFDKSVGVRAIAKRLDIELSSIGGIGDAPNDVKWLELIGTRAVPCDGHPDVKAIEGINIARFPASEGVVEILDLWFPEQAMGTARSDRRSEHSRGEGG